MKNKVIGIFVCVMLVLTTIMVIVPDDLKVEAISGEDDRNESTGLDYEYIYNITKLLSFIINDTAIYPPGTLAKGRSFGSDGERYAAINILKPEMINLGLYNPGLDPPYLERIQNIRSKFDKEIPSVNLTDHLDTLSFGITVNDEINETSTTLADFHIEPMWNWRCILAFFEHKCPNLDEILELIESILKINTSDFYKYSYICNESWLTKNVTHNHLSLVPRPNNFSWLLDFFRDKIEDISCNESIVDYPSFMYYFLSEFQKYYNFTFGELNPGNASIKLPWFDTQWKPPTIGEDKDFLYIGEDRAFNPNETEDYFVENITDLLDCFPGLDWLIPFIEKASVQIEMLLWNRTMPHCKGLLNFDFNDNTHNMQNGALRPLPTLYINGSIGKKINASYNDYNISFWINQSWTENVESYNVIGQINGTDPTKTVIIGCLYDCWWNQGTADSAIGMGMVLAIAKYFKDNNITPKYNLKFIGFAGEEQGLRGAYYYESKHSTENVITVIDLNQVGFSQVGPPLTLELIINNYLMNSTVNEIANCTQYEEGMDDGTNLTVVNVSDFSVPSDYYPFYLNRSASCNTVCFLKDMGWIHHHRDGQNHQEGDSLKYYYEPDVNLTAELVWNVTKYFCVDPDCSFSNVSYEAFDSTDDGDTLPDSIRANFTIHTTIPQDKVMVDLWKCVYGNNFSALSTYATENYTVTPAGKHCSMVFTIPDGANEGNYSINLKLYNSTGRINYLVDIEDKPNETSQSSDTYRLYHPFGYTEIGGSSQNVNDRISGSVFTANEYGTADNISAYVQADLSIPPVKSKCMIYRNNDSTLIGVTDEIIPSAGAEPRWTVFNFSDPKPVLKDDVEYVLSCWSNKTCNLYYDDFEYERGRRDDTTYGSPPDPANFISESRLYSLYCSYTKDMTPPQISDVTVSPNTVGFGCDANISASIIDPVSGIDTAKVNITYPNHTHVNCTMMYIAGDTYQYPFNDTWEVGQYNYTIWATDKSSNGNSTTGHFHVSATATINIATLKDDYVVKDYINITDPPIPTEDYYLVDRGLTWDEYYNAITGENALEISAGPINYQDGNNEWTPIDCTLSTLNSNHPAYQHGYRAGNDHGLYNVYFKPNAQNDWPVAFAYDKSNDPTTNVVRSKLVGVGYLDPTSNWAYQYLQNVQSSQGQINDNSITCEGVFTGVDVTYSYDNTQLKEEITLGNSTKTLLQNHPPSNYELSNDNSYLVFITRLDHQNLNMHDSSGILSGNATIYDGQVDFKDSFGNFKCALPIGDAYELNDEQSRQELTYRIIQYNGNTYLLSGLKLSDLNSMTFPIIIDPTLSIESATNDGYIYKSSGTYNTAWTSSTGTVSSSATYISIGQKKDSAAPPTLTYSIYRGFMIFDTSRLPSNAYIDNATLSLYKYNDYSTTDFTITVQNGQPTYPHNPLQTGDYSKSRYSGNGGGLNTASFVNGRNNITLTNHSWLTKEGTTKFCLRSSRDINGTSPTGDEFVNVYSGDASATYRPKLIITYRNQSKIKDTGLTNIKGYLLIQVQFHNISWPAGQWVVDQDAVNETTARTIDAGQQLALDTIFNGLVNTIDLTHGNGRYRVYAAFRDTYGNILQTDDGRFLAAWWEFDVDI